MDSEKGKISIMQATILYLVLGYTALLRRTPGYAAEKAGQAGWLIPFLSIPVFTLLGFLFNSLYKGYKGRSISLNGIIMDVFGKPLGTMAAAAYLFYMTLLTGFMMRLYTERLLSTIFPQTNINVFIIIMLILVSAALHYGLTVIARMSEIIFPVLLISFLMLTVAIIPQIDLYMITPVSINDVLPVAEGSLIVTSVLSHYSLLFFFSDRININKNNIKKSSILVSIYLGILNPIFFISCIGSLSPMVVANSSFPYLAVIKNIKLFSIIEKIEPVVITLWIMSDFIFISILIYISLKIMKELFGLKRVSSLKNIYLIFIYVFTLFFALNAFELDRFSGSLMIYIALFFQVIIPILLLITGKIRRRGG